MGSSLPPGHGDFRLVGYLNIEGAPIPGHIEATLDAFDQIVTTSEVGDAALFLLSDLARGITGEVMHVDAGYHVVGMKAEDAPDIAVASGRNEA